MGIKPSIYSIQTDTLSKFRTFHNFEYFGEIKTLDDYLYYYEWAKQNNKKIYILGNGSNTLFTRKNINTLVLRNKIEKKINCISLENNLYEITSNTMVYEVLNFCLKSSLDSFYYLASVPATIGGALAMNAGEGKQINRSIYDFVYSVTYIDNNTVKTIKSADMELGFRETMFTGCQDKFIVSAIFKFPNRDLIEKNPIKERILWAKNYQDNVAPNCGSTFKEAYSPIMKLLRGVKIGKTQYSSKTRNWINNKSKSSIPILLLIYLAKILHTIMGKKCEIEVIRIK